MLSSALPAIWRAFRAPLFISNSSATLGGVSRLAVLPRIDPGSQTIARHAEAALYFSDAFREGLSRTVPGDKDDQATLLILPSSTFTTFGCVLGAGTTRCGDRDRDGRSS